MFVWWTKTFENPPHSTEFLLSPLVFWILHFSRKRPRRVLSKKALPLKTVIKDCHQTSPKVLLKWWLSLKFVIFKDCHQRLPKVLLKWWLSWLSSKTAQSSTEAMAVFKDCHQRLLKVLLKWWLSERLEKRLQRKDWRNRLKVLKYILFLSGAQGSHLWIWQPSRHFVRVGRSKLW